MNKRIVIVFASLVILGGCLYGAYLYYTPKVFADPTTNAPEETSSDYTYTYLTSTAETTAYCDGNNMDSAGYRTSLTVANAGTISKSKPTTDEIIRATIDSATTGMCHTVMTQTKFTEKDGIVTIAPIDAWAGMSITMCSCKPQVEVNILQIPNMKQVIWSTNNDYPEDTIILDTPLPNTIVNNPLFISGKARGSWYFEASFPIYLLDSHGNMLGQGVAQAKSDWMTDDFVPFETTITFIADPQIIGDAGTLILQKDNPSGLHEDSDAVRIPVIIGK